MSRINIIITDGNISYKLYWLKQTSKGIYHGYTLPSKKDIHQSYHVDGNSWFTIDGKKELRHKLTPLSDIKDCLSLCTIALSRDSFRLYEKDVESLIYKGEKLDNIIWIDIRSFPHNSTINILLNLVKPEYLSTLFSYPRYQSKKGNFHLMQIINSINPWLFVHVIGVGTPVQKRR